jgi:Poly(A) polymerase catalytic subunit
MSRRYETKLCDDKMTFQECELAILRHAVDESEKRSKSRITKNPDIHDIIQILEGFLRKRMLICYGGLAINNVLPKEVQFYDRDIEIPDYDFYSPKALEHAMELADLYYEAGYKDVEAKSGVHYGTFKVFVNFIPIADITYLHTGLFSEIKKDAIIVDGIYYAPPNFLRMNMFLELSRPAGDVSRWEKVLKRLNLLNEYYPLDLPKRKCGEIEIQRKLDSKMEIEQDVIYNIVRDTFIQKKVVFFGGYAGSLYARYIMPKGEKRFVMKIPDFDVLSETAEETASDIVKKLLEVGLQNVRKVFHREIGEIIPKHYEIVIGEETIAFIYEPIACHSYNTIYIQGKEVRVATIDTMLTFYLAFYYSNKTYYYRDRILCMAKILFDVEQKNRLAQKGVLKRFSISCYGKQKTLDEIRAEKSEKYKTLQNDRNSKEYKMWFLKYSPESKDSSSPKVKASKTDVESRPRPEATRRRDGSKPKTKTKKNLIKFVSEPRLPFAI